MESIVLVLHLIAGIAIIVLVLLQHGKGADMGAAFGSGSAGSLFGSSGAANFLSRSTAVLATIFFVSSLGLTFLSTPKSKSGGVTESLSKTTAPASSQPAVPAPVAPAPASDPTATKSQQIPK